VGITESSLDETILIYPNPAKDFVTIAFKNNTIATISLLNSLGQIVFHSDNEVNTHKLSIPIHQYSKGLYFVKVFSGEAIQTYKLMIGN
jgi:Secretion system C-terminal sorting domain